MQPEHVPVPSDLDRVVLAVQTLIALVAVLAAYAAAKLGRGWWPPHRHR